MAATLYQKCPMCDGTTTLKEPAWLNTGGTTVNCPCRGSRTPGWAEVGLTVGQVDKVIADRARLRTALDQCDTVMDTAALHGLPQQLPDVYRNTWILASIDARAALAATGG